MKNILIYIGLAVLIGASAIAAFTGLDLAVWITLAAAAATLAGTIIKLVKDAGEEERKDWKLYAAITGMVIGVILLVFAGIAGDTIKAVITAVIGIVALVLSIILPTIKKHNKK